MTKKRDIFADVFELVEDIQDANIVYQSLGTIETTTVETLDDAYAKVLECDDALLTYLEELQK